MKKTITLLLTILLTICCLITSAQQVRQIFKIMEFPTDKPLKGATCTYYGQTITSNAKGVAIINLPVERKGDFIPRDRWTLDNYVYIGRISYDARNQYFQSRDTLRLYMVKKSDYDTDVHNLFKQYFNFAYQATAQAMLAHNDSLSTHPDMDKEYAQRLMGYAAESYYQLVDDAYSDAINTLPSMLFSFPPETQEGITEILRSGNINRAVAEAKAQIREGDTSLDNLHRIAFFLTLRDLNLATQDTLSVLEYQKTLYEQHYSINSTTNYIIALSNEERFDEAEAIARKEITNPHLPSEEHVFHPLPQKFFGIDDDSLRIGFSRQNQMIRDNYRRYPSYDFMDELAWNYLIQTLVHTYLSDTLSANQSIDSSLSLYKQWMGAYSLSKKAQNQRMIRIYSRMLKMLSPNFSYRIDSIRLKVAADVRQAAKENYEMEPENLFLQLQYAAWTNQYIDILDDSDSLWDAAVRDLSALDDILVQKYPEIFVVENIVTKSRVLGIDLDTGQEESAILRSYRPFKEAYTAANSLYPDIFTSTYLTFVSYVSEEAHNRQHIQLAAEADLFMDDLLKQSARHAGQFFEVWKAQYLNYQAEQHYQQKNYPKAIQYYEQANEQFQKATVQDHSQWIPFLRNFLQMGDAYLNQGNFDEALNTYRTVLTYESQIPADQAAAFTAMKGDVFYYEGDVWKGKGDAATAEKCYKKAEKFFLKAIKMGETSTYHSLGEMYMGKAIIEYNKGNEQKVYPLMEQSVKYYESCPFDKPLQRYVQAKFVMEDYYWNIKDSVRYTKTLRDLADFFHQFAEYDTFYVNKSIEYAGKYLRYKLPPEEELHYCQNIVTDYGIILPTTGLSLSYLQRKFQLAKAWQGVDSIQQAINEFKECLSLNTTMYQDTAPNFRMANETEIYKSLIECFSTMGELYEHEENLSKEWYDKALDASDTLIRIMEFLYTDDNAQQTYEIAMQYYRNAILCTQTGWESIALTQLDKSNEMLVRLYNDQYKDETESDIIRNHFFKGIIAEEMSNFKLAQECYQSAVEYAGKASDPNDVAYLYYETVKHWLDILEKTDDGQETTTITKLRKLKATLSKKVGK